MRTVKRHTTATDSQSASAGSETFRTVVVALAANVGIAVAKLVAALASGSSAMLAEAFHAFADSGNQVLLLVAQKRGGRPADAVYPLGHGRESYFWALIASLAVFVTGALLSVRQGIHELIHPSPAASFRMAYAVLLISFVLEGLSLRRAYQQLTQEARDLKREFLEHLDLTSDPIARAVFAEDAAAVIGNVVAAVGLGLHQLTGSAIPDAIAAIIIGLTLAYVAWQLTRRNAEFLVGRQASPRIRDAVRETILRQPGVRAIAELVIVFLGPRRLWVMARIEIGDAITVGQAKQLVQDTTAALRRQSAALVRIDIMPAG